MNINVTLKFEEIPATALAMANQKAWAARLGGYTWLIFFDPEKKTYTAAFRNLKYHSGISSNPMIVIEMDIESFDKAAEACAIMYMTKTAPNEDVKLVN